MRSASRVSEPAYSHQSVEELEGFPTTPFLRAAADAKKNLTGFLGFEPPSWEAVAAGARPPLREPEDFEPGIVRQGWQHEASSRKEQHFRDEFFKKVSQQVQALVRSQGGPCAGAALSTVPTNRETTIPFHLFRVKLLRRLRQPLPLSVCNCRCGRLLDVCGHHRAACARVAMLGRRGFALESAAARICREAWRKSEDEHVLAGHGPGCAGG